MSDHDQPVVANLLNRNFTRRRRISAGSGETSEFVVGDGGKLYWQSILDLFSRFVVSWAVSAVNDRHVT